MKTIARSSLPPALPHQELAPPDELRAVVQCFWHARLDLGGQLAGQLILPDSSAEIIFHFGGPCRLDTGEGERALPSPCLLGPLRQPARLYAAGSVDIIGIRCFPWAVGRLLGDWLAGASSAPAGHPLAHLQAILARWHRAGGPPVQALAQFAQYSLGTLPPANHLLDRAGRALRAGGGTLPVGQVAAAAHATVRTLERHFKQAAGHTVKGLSGLLRFEQTRNQLWLYPTTNLASLAQELGYVDQAHLSREFKRYSGMTPTTFARSYSGLAGSRP